MYRLMTTKGGQLFYVFEEDAYDEMRDFQDEVFYCLDTIIDALNSLKHLVHGHPIPEPMPFPKQPLMVDAEPVMGELPF